MYGVYRGRDVLALRTGVLVTSGSHGDCCEVLVLASSDGTD